MAFASATITMNSGESITCTGILFRANTGLWTITGATDMLTRSTLGVNATSATAGTILSREVSAISFS